MALFTRKCSTSGLLGCCVLVLALACSQLAAALTLPQEKHYRQDISTQWAVFVDTTGIEKLDEIRSRRYEFIPAAQFQAPLAPLQSYWLRLTLENPSQYKNTSWLQMDLALARNVLLYQIDGPYIKTHGISYTTSDGRQQRQALAHFSIVTPAQSASEIYVRLTRPWRADFATTLSDPLDHQRSTDRSLLISGFCFGGMLLLMLAALVSGWPGGRRDYLWLALLAACAIVYAAVQQGLLLLLAPVNNSGSRLLQLAPLFSQAAFIIALLLTTRGLKASGNAAPPAYIVWGGILASITALLAALFDFGLAYYGLALIEALIIVILLLFFVASLRRELYRPLLLIGGLACYAFGAWPLLSATLAPITGFSGTAPLASSLGVNPLYQAGALVMLVLFALAQALHRGNTAGGQSIPENTYIDTDVDEVESLALEHLTGKSNPDWWRLTEASFDGVLLCEQGRILYANQSAADLIGHDKVEMIGKPISLLLGSGHDSEELLALAALKPALLHSDTGDGAHRPLELRSRQQWVDHRQLYFASLRLAAERSSGSNAFYDGLTGLAGQQLLSERVEQAIKAADRHPASHALLFVELDQLPALKQRYGRQRADRMLQTLATRLGQSTRRENTVARVGDAHFAVFVENLANTQAAAKVAGQVLQTLKRPVHLDERELLTSASIGIAIYPEDADTLPQLLQLAEKASESTRLRGPNRYQFYNDDINRRVAAQLNLEASLQEARNDVVSALREAQSQNNFTLTLQAVSKLQDNSQVGSIAGLSWPDSPPDYRHIDQLYDLAAEVDLDRDISACMLQAACEFEARTADSSSAGTIGIKIAAAHFLQHDFVDQVNTIVALSSCNAQHIMLTFDEAVLTRQLKLGSEKLGQLRQSGLQIGIDHFADGQTSLLLLRTGLISQVAMTTSWIKSVGTHKQDLKALRALVKLCHRLHLQVHIDQVSTESHLKVARLIESDTASGAFIEQCLPQG